MMKDILINVSRETRMVNLTKSVIGNDNENLQSKLVFSFSDEFVDGQARIEYVINNVKNYQVLKKEGESYTIPIKNVLTKKGQIDMQLVITEPTIDDEIPIFKSNVFYLVCNRSINAESEQPSEYLQWIDIANSKLNEIDQVIDNTNNVSNYAKEQGDYAKEQGDYAKEKAKEISNANDEATEIIKGFEANVAGYTNNFNTNAETKQKDYDTNAEKKLEEYNQNARNSKESFNTNASTKTTEFNDNATAKTTAFDSNATAKTSEFNENATSKTDDFNSNVNSKTEEFNSNAESKQNDYDTNAELKTTEFNENASSLQEQCNNLQEENERLNKTISNLPKVKEQVGTDLTLDNTSVGYFYHDNEKGMLLSGNIEQKTTTGKNLVNIPNIELVQTTSANFYVNVESGETYTFSSLITNKGNAERTRVRVKINDNYYQGNYIAPGTKGLSQITIIVPNDITEIRVDLLPEEHALFENIMLESGDTATDFEPFTNGPSPNPEFPSEVKVTRGWNIFDGEIELGYINLNDGSLVDTTGSTRSKNFTKVKPNTTYSFLREGGYYRRIVGYTKDKVGVSDGKKESDNPSVIYASGVTEKEFLFTTTATTEYIKWCDSASIDLSEKVQIAEGTEEKPYMPFNTIGINVSNKNLFDINNPLFSSIDEYASNHKPLIENGIIKSGGIAGDTSGAALCSSTYKKKKITISFIPLTFESRSYYEIVGLQNSSSIGAIEKGTNLKTGRVTSKSKIIETIDNVSDYNYLGLRMYSDTKYGLSIKELQFEDGITSTPYVPHQEQNFLLSLGDLWLGKIGEYKDKFFKNILEFKEYNESLEYGKWYLKKEIAKVVLDGSEVWSLKNTTDINLHFSTTLLDTLTSGNVQPLCNSFSHVNYIWENDKQGIELVTKPYHLRIRINSDLLDTTSRETIFSSFRTLLSTYNIEVWFSLTTPEYVPLNDTLQAQLDDIYNALSYKGQTNISQEADVPFEISASALYDLDNLIDRVAVLETA